VLAPFTPFVAEEIYQNLVVNALSSSQTNSERNGASRSSVHHTDWPQADAKAIDEALIEEMGLARQIASLGLSARGNAGLKVRQPLKAALVHRAEAIKLSPDAVEIIMDELNVKEFVPVEDAAKLVSYKLLPDNAKLGPRFGADFPKLRAALEGMDAAEVKARLDAGESVLVTVGAEEHELAADEILVQSEPAAGLAVAAEKGVTVAVDAEITAELKAEGLARELVRRIQDLRKKADFNIEDRITTYYQAESELAAVFEAWGETIQAETLSTALEAGPAPKGAYSEELQIEGEKLVLGVERV